MPRLDREEVRRANPLERVIAELTGHALEGDGHEPRTRCPFHEDRSPSLRVHREKQTWYCDPCHTGGDVFRFVELHQKCDFAGSLRFLAERAGIRTNGNHAEPEAVYQYRDVGGQVTMEVVRFPGKQFRQRRPDGHGGYIWNLDGVEPPLYHRDKLALNGTVLVVEGEKDADALRRLNLPGTCNAGGAKKWKPAHTKQLVDAGVSRVVVIPDNDPPGHKHADQVARSCTTAGLVVKVVNLPEGVKDVSDYLADHGKAELAALIKAAPRYEPSAVTDTTPPTRTPVITWLNTVTPEEVSWIWPGRMARGKYQVLVGDPDLGKTTVALDCAARLSVGGVWPDGTAAPQGKTLILTAEDGIADTIRPRIDKLGGDPSQVGVLEAVRDEHGRRPLNLKRDLDMLAAAIEQARPLLVIIDPVSAYLGDTNSHKDSEVRGLLNPIKDILERYQVTLLAIAHLNKNQQQAVIHRTSGSVAFVAAARLGWVVAADPDDAERRVLAMFKHNLCAKAPSLTYTLDGGAVTWDLSARNIDAESLLQASSAEGRSEQRDAVELLEDLLEDGPMKQADVVAAARKNGISESTLRRAKRRIGVVASKQGFKRDAFWLWRLPESHEGCQHHTSDHLRDETRENPNKTTKAVEDGHPSELTAFAHEDGHRRLSPPDLTTFVKTLEKTSKTTKMVNPAIGAAGSADRSVEEGAAAGVPPFDPKAAFGDPPVPEDARAGLPHVQEEEPDHADDVRSY